MKEYERQRNTKASPEAVWKVWSDTATWGAWNPNVASMEMRGPFAEGTTGVMHTKSNKHHEVRLVNVKDGRSFDLVTKVVPGTQFEFHCEVTAPSPSAPTQIRQSLRVSGPLGGLFGAMAGNRIAETFRPLLDGLARAAET